MELTARTNIPFPRPLVFKTIRDKLPALAQYMPNVKNIEGKERHDDGPRARFVNIWTAQAEVPAMAQRYLQPELFQWTDRALWDESQFSCDWSIETHAWPGVVECSGRNVYTTAGEATVLEIHGSLVLNMDKAPIPRLLGATVRPVVERIIVAALKPNLVSIGDAVSGYLKANPGG